MKLSDLKWSGFLLLSLVLLAAPAHAGLLVIVSSASVECRYDISAEARTTGNDALTAYMQYPQGTSYSSQTMVYEAGRGSPYAQAGSIYCDS